MKKILLLFSIVLLYPINGHTQNLLDTYPWRVGNGSTYGFNKNGSTAENTRENGTDPFGGSTVIWKCTPDNVSGPDGGWITLYSSIDHTKDYRLAVWIKKTGANTGTTYFGTNSPNTLLAPSGSINNNPYFWYGDLPQLNKWYLLIGYVHKSGYSGSFNDGGIYDPDTGERMVTITDYKFTTNATLLRHRAYLYYDTNTTDRQYFYAPRMEMVNGNEPSIPELLRITSDEGNLLEADFQNWISGSGSAPGFNQNGSTTENSRENGTDPFGNNALVWKASPDNVSGPDGGWSTHYHDIDHTKDYRLAVWIKKTGANTGTTYFGTNSPNTLLTPSGSINNNPYFWYGDLPQLNKWYLLIGYVHKSSYTGLFNYGGIYDLDTGERVVAITDYKFTTAATRLRHRTYLYYDTNTNDRQYFYAPRMEQVNGSEPSINSLLGRREATKLVFTFDTAGNQTQRRFPTNTSSLKARLDPESFIAKDQTAREEASEPDDRAAELEASISVYPNPTDGDLAMEWNRQYNGFIKAIRVSDMANRAIRVRYDQGGQQARVDLGRYPPGIYLVNFELHDGRQILKKIIKK